MGNKHLSKQQAQEERQRAVQESSLIAIQLSLNDSCPSLPIPGRPNYQHFLLTIELFETFRCPGAGRERGAGCLCTSLSAPCTQGPDWLQGDWISLERAEQRLWGYQTPWARFGSG